MGTLFIINPYIVMFMKQMKQTIMLCLLWLIGMGASAIPNNTIYYTTTDGRTLSVKTTDGTDSFGANVVSNVYSDGQGIITFDDDVTKIGSYAIVGKSYLRSIILPNTVKTIENGAFSLCKELMEINIPESVTAIKGCVFEGCNKLPVYNNLRYADTYLVEAVDKKLESYVIKDGTKWIGYNAFNNCSLLTSIELPNTLVNIGYEAFSGCSKLESVIIPNAVTVIERYAFDSCKKLTNVVLSNSLKEIGIGAFANTAFISINLPESLESIDAGAFNFSMLQSLYIPKSVAKVGIDELSGFDSSPFVGCIYLTSIVVDKDNPYYDSRDNCNAIIETSTNALVSGCRTTIIPNTVETIASYAFSKLDFKFNSIEIPASVKSIGGAFSDCSSLASVTMKSIPTMQSSTFSKIKSGATITLELSDSEHPYIASSVTNAPTFSFAKYTRTLAAGKYGTIILPFVPDNADDFIFYTLDDCKNDELTFKPVQTVEAGVPYLYKNADGCSATEMTASNVDGTTLKVTSTDPSAVNGWQFKGNYANTVLTGTEYYVINNNQFVNTTANVNMIPFRAYLQNMSASAPKSLRIIEEDGEVTCISAADLEGFGQEHGTVYDLSGRRVTDNANLKGIYIINGKKVLR